MKAFVFSVVATEGSQTNEVPLEIEVADVNDNDPTFTQPLYTASINEDQPIGEKILQGLLKVLFLKHNK